MQKGFTLLETLIALAIIATALTAILTLSHNSVATTRKLQDRFAAELLAENNIRQIQAGFIVVPKAPYKYNNTAALLEKKWVIAAYTTPMSLPTILQLHVEVKNPNNEAPLVHLISYIGTASD